MFHPIEKCCETDQPVSCTNLCLCVDSSIRKWISESHEEILRKLNLKDHVKRLDGIFITGSRYSNNNISLAVSERI